jgi:hypothetical protein
MSARRELRGESSLLVSPRILSSTGTWRYRSNADRGVCAPVPSLGKVTSPSQMGRSVSVANREGNDWVALWQTLFPPQFGPWPHCPPIFDGGKVRQRPSAPVPYNQPFISARRSLRVQPQGNSVDRRPLPLPSDSAQVAQPGQVPRTSPEEAKR